MAELTKPPYQNKVTDPDGYMDKGWLKFFLDWAQQILTGLVQSVTGTAGRILITGTATDPIINLDPAYVASVAQGGTGQSAYTLGDTLYASAPTALAKLPGATNSFPLILTQTGTGSLSAAPAWMTRSALLGAFNVRDYGAKGDGVTDDTAAIQACITAAANAGGTIVDSGEVAYIVTDQLNIPTGKRLGIRNLRLLVTLPGTSGHNHVISNYSSVSATTTFTGSVRGTLVRAQDTTIYVTSTTGMAVGDILQIDGPHNFPTTSSIWKWPFNHNNARWRGETNKIASINSPTSVTLSMPLFCGYDTADLGAGETINIKTLTPQIVDIDGLDIKFTTPQACDGVTLSALDSTSRLNRISVDGAQNQGIFLGDSFGVEITDPIILNGYLSGAGYGVAFSQCTASYIFGGYAYRCRHGQDFSGDFPTHGCSVIGMTVVGHPTEGSCLGTHGPANMTSFLDCMLFGGPNGIIIRSPNTLVQGCQFHGHESSAVIISGAPSQIIRNNVHRLGSGTTTKGNPDATDAIFMEVDTALGQDNDLYLDGNNEFVIEGNTVNPTLKFIHFRDTITKLENFTIRGNTVNLQAAGGSFLFSANTSGVCQINGTCYIGENKVNGISGAYTEFNNLQFNTPSTVGSMTESIGKKHYVYGKALTAGTYAVAYSRANNLVFESNTHIGQSWLVPDTKEIRMCWGTPGAETSFFFQTNGGSQLQIGTGFVGGILRLYAGNSVLAIELTAALINLLLPTTVAADLTAATRIILSQAGGGYIRSDNDTKAVIISGGSVDQSAAHGATVNIYGNTNAGTGAVELSAGDVVGGVVNFYTANIIRMTILRDGTVKNISLAGTGSRFVQADSTGIESATIAVPTGAISETRWIKTASTTVANTTTETTLLDTGVGSKTLASAFLTVGKSIPFEIYGIYSTTLTPTLQFKFKLGSTVILDSGAITTANTVTNQAFCFYGTLTCRSTGATGTVFAQGGLVLGGLTTPLVGVVNTGTSTIDTTGTLAMDLTATWGSVSISDTLTATNAVIESKG